MGKFIRIALLSPLFAEDTYIAQGTHSNPAVYPRLVVNLNQAHSRGSPEFTHQN